MGSQRVRHNWGTFTNIYTQPYTTTGKTIALTRWTFVGEVMFLLCNMLSRFVIAFLPRNKSFHFRAALTICSDFWALENKVFNCLHCFPISLPWSDGTQMPWSLFCECWVLSQHFHSPLSSGDPLVPLYFLSLEWCHLHIWGVWYFSQQSWF